MKIVIDIPNWLYNAIMEHKEPQYSRALGDAVRNGIPLPKGHGRLIDADKLRAVYTKPHLVGFDEIIEDIDSQPTVLEGEE